MLKKIIKRDILNSVSIINEISNIKSRLKKHSITFFLINANPI